MFADFGFLIEFLRRGMTNVDPTHSLPTPIHDPQLTQRPLIQSHSRLLQSLRETSS